MTTEEEDITVDENQTVEAPEESVAGDPKTFDLIGALSGRSYPEETVPVFLDEGAMYTYAKISEMSANDPKNEKLQEAVDNYLKDLKGITFHVKVKGVPNHVLASIGETVTEKYPTKPDAFGNVKENPEADKMFSQLLWEAYVVEITDPTGAKANLTKEAIEEFRKQAPKSAVNAVEDAIRRLRNDSDSGYEQAVKGLDFLSQPSPKG